MTDTVTAKLAEWEALVEGATEGPWREDDASASVETVWTLEGDDEPQVICDWLEPGDAAFVAASRTALPALLGFVREVQGLAEWHETKAEKARAFPGAGHENVMEKAAQVHDDAARRLRQAARKWLGGQG